MLPAAASAWATCDLRHRSVVAAGSVLQASWPFWKCRAFPRTSIAQHPNQTHASQNELKTRMLACSPPPDEKKIIRFVGGLCKNKFRETCDLCHRLITCPVIMIVGGRVCRGPALFEWIICRLDSRPLGLSWSPRYRGTRRGFRRPVESCRTTTTLGGLIKARGYNCTTP